MKKILTLTVAMMMLLTMVVPVKADPRHNIVERLCGLNRRDVFDELVGTIVDKSAPSMLRGSYKQYLKFAIDSMDLLPTDEIDMGVRQPLFSRRNVKCLLVAGAMLTATVGMLASDIYKAYNNWNAKKGN